MNQPPCPKCKSKQTYITTTDHIKYFNCTACQYQTRMKHYRAKHKQLQSSNKTQ